MKEAITGYITGIINFDTRAIERLKANRAPVAHINSIKDRREEFNDLLEFVMDIPTEPVIETLAFEITILKQRAAELEESYENMCEHENKLHVKIKKLEATLIEFREQFLDDKEKIKNLENEKNEFWECNKQLNQLYKEKRSENEVLQTQNKKLKYDNKKLHKKIELLRKKSNGPIRKNV